MRTFMVLVGLGAALATLGCKRKEAPGDAPASRTTSLAATISAAPPSALAPPPSATASAAHGPTIDLELSTVGDTMAFDKTSFTVPTGAQVHLTLKNNGTTLAMQHNWVLVTAGSEAAVALAGLEKAPQSGYVVPSPEVLAYTPLAPPRQSVEVTFTAPAPGKYPFICTFPGHYLLMKGVLTVTP